MYELAPLKEWASALRLGTSPLAKACLIAASLLVTLLLNLSSSPSARSRSPPTELRSWSKEMARRAAVGRDGGSGTRLVHGFCAWP
eukprot:3983874-Prymnesium_polylepis.1